MLTSALPDGRGGPDAGYERLADHELMPLVARGDVRAFDVLHRRHRANALGLARHICGPDLADDVVQTAFVSFWRHRDQYRSELGSPRAWLLGIVRHRAVDELRSRAAQRRRTTSIEHWAGSGIAVSAAEATYERIALVESGATLRRSLMALPMDQRKVVALAYVEGYSQSEIASVLGVPLGTVKSRVRLGLAKLRADWDAGAALAA